MTHIGNSQLVKQHVEPPWLVQRKGYAGRFRPSEQCIYYFTR